MSSALLAIVARLLLTASDPVVPPSTSAAAPLRLALESVNGCAVLPSGDTVSRGKVAIPYPSKCESLDDEAYAPAPPKARLELAPDRTYVLNQVTLVHQVVGKHQSLTDVQAPLKWMTTQSRFKRLDWKGAAVAHDDWTFVNPRFNLWQREVFYGGAAWMQQKDDTFLVELLDGAGAVRSQARYRRADFWSESPITGHTRVSWRVYGIPPPTPPGTKAPPGEPVQPSSFITTVRVDLAGALDPSLTVSTQGLKGDGAVRVTWSALPKEPFYFPFTVVDPAQAEPTCFKGGAKVRCDFGLAPDIALRPPAGGKRHYAPGEELLFDFKVRDGAGSLIHSEERFASYTDFFAGKANGILYYRTGLQRANDLNYMTLYKIIGPLQDVAGTVDSSGPSRYYQFPPQLGGDHAEGEMVSPAAAMNSPPGLVDVAWPTRYPLVLPKDAKPGTYLAILKTARFFLGERVAKSANVFFQVGTDEQTHFPGVVGKCEACHNGPSALEQLHHGFPTANIEGCRACHSSFDLSWTARMHKLHFRSARFQQKANCTLCHLTRAEAVRPSFEACGSCHQDLHKGKYFATQFNLEGAPTRYQNCAQSCHADTAPRGHVLPEAAVR